MVLSPFRIFKNHSTTQFFICQQLFSHFRTILFFPQLFLTKNYLLMHIFQSAENLKKIIFFEKNY